MDRGSGILGVAAHYYWVRKSVCDIDPQAVLATRQNAELNGVLNGLLVDF